MTESVSSPLLGDVQAHIAQLWVYPVKSCAGIALERAELTADGLRHDRNWMVVDHEGAFVTQRELPQMVLIQPELTASACVLRAPGMAPLALPFEAQGAEVAVRIWDDGFSAFDMGDEAARWLTEFLAPQAPSHLKRLRLVRFDPGVRRLCSPRWTGGHEATTRFADGFGVLVTSLASLEGLNARLAAGGLTAVDMRRFRPNVVIGGVEPHDEDRIGAWRIATGQGVAALENVKPCARCPMPNIDPQTGLSAPDVNDTLQPYRQDRRLGGAVTFGMNAIVLEGAGSVLALGQAVGADWRFD